MSKTAILSVRIVSDAKAASKTFDNFASKLDKLEGRVSKFASYGSAASAAVGAIGASTVKAASELQQSTGAIEAVFKDQADQVKAWADTAAQSVGLASAEYQNMAALIGSQLKNMGMDMEAVTPKTNRLIELGADLAATYGGDAAQAVEALSSALKGEYDPIERYGISIKKADINARLAAKGMADLEGEALRLAETEVLLEMVTEQSTDALGMFGREADTAAGQTQRAKAEWENAKAELGSGLLPIVTKAAQWLSVLAAKAGEHPGVFVGLAAAIVGTTGALWGIIGAIKAYQGAVALWAGVKATWDIIHNSLAMTAIRVWLLSARQAVAAAARATFAWVAMVARTIAGWVAMGARAVAQGAIAAAAWTASAARAAAAWIAPRLAMIAATAATAAATAAQWLLNAALTANPIGIVIGLVVAFGAALVVAYKKSETFRNFVNRAAATAVSAFSRVVGPINAIANAVASVINWISRIRWPKPPAWASRFMSVGGPSFTGVPGMETMLKFMAPPVTTFGNPVPDLTAAAPPAPPGGLLPAGTGAMNVNVDNSVTVQVDGSGIADPRAVAEAIRRALRQDGVNRGYKIMGLAGNALWQ